MILGVGNDMIDIRRIAATLDRFGDRFTDRIFTSVEQAKSVGDLRADAEVRRNAITTTEVVGSHSYYFVDGTWTRDDYEQDTDAPEIEVGSDEFLELIALDPSLADAAALGERVVTEGPDGWVTIVWPDVD